MVWPGLNEQLISLCRWWSPTVMQAVNRSVAVDCCLVPFHSTPEFCLCTRFMDTTQRVATIRGAMQITKSGNYWSVLELLTSLPFKDTLPESLNSVELQTQRWTALSLLWPSCFSSSAGLVALRTMERLCPAQNAKRVLMAPAMNLWVCSGPSSTPRDGVSVAEATWLSSWTMKLSSSSRGTCSQRGTGGWDWHLLLQTSHWSLTVRGQRDAWCRVDATWLLI